MLEEACWSFLLWTNHRNLEHLQKTKLLNILLGNQSRRRTGGLEDPETVTAVIELNAVHWGLSLAGPKNGEEVRSYMGPISVSVLTPQHFPHLREILALGILQLVQEFMVTCPTVLCLGYVFGPFDYVTSLQAATRWLSVIYQFSKILFNYHEATQGKGNSRDTPGRSVLYTRLPRECGHWSRSPVQLAFW